MTEVLFDDPGSGNNIEWEDFLGKLLIIWPFGQEEIKTNDYGEKDAIRADMVVLDGADGPEELPDILVFPLVLQGQLKRNIKTGKPVVGRLGQGEAKGKQNPPWKLMEASEADKVKAVKYLTAKKTKAKSNNKFDDVPF